MGPCSAVKLKDDDNILVYADTCLGDKIRLQTFDLIENNWINQPHEMSTPAPAKTTILHRFGDYVMFLGDGKYFWYNPYTREKGALKDVPIALRPRGRCDVPDVAFDEKTNIWTFVLSAEVGGTRLRMVQFDKVEPGKDLSRAQNSNGKKVTVDHKIYQWRIRNNVLAI